MAVLFEMIANDPLGQDMDSSTLVKAFRLQLRSNKVRLPVVKWPSLASASPGGTFSSSH